MPYYDESRCVQCPRKSHEYCDSVACPRYYPGGVWPTERIKRTPASCGSPAASISRPMHFYKHPFLKTWDFICPHDTPSIERLRAMHYCIKMNNARMP